MFSKGFDFIKINLNTVPFKKINLSTAMPYKEILWVKFQLIEQQKIGNATTNFFDFETSIVG